jgi:hypothetical protein
MADGLRAFPGLDYFKDNAVDRALFFGRDHEIKQLTARLIAEDLTVLFGKSGDGKTSLINAGLKPALREAGYLPVRARVFNVVAPITPLIALYEAIAEEAKINGVTLPPNWQHETLWESFLALRPTPENGLKPIVLVLDQFEELFTLMADRPQEQKDFVAQCADLVRGRLPETVREKYRSQLAGLTPDSDEARQLEQLLYGSPAPALRIVLSLREDYLAFLNNLGRRIPKVFASRYRLASLTIEEARAAIANPPQQEVLSDKKFHIEDDAIEALLKFLAVQSSRSGVSEEIVGPPQLQVLCQQLEAQMRQRGKNRISLTDLGGDAGMRQLLSRYYRGILEKFPRIRFGPGPRRLSGLLGLARQLQPVHSPRLAVRQLCEERLITTGGNRNSRHEDEILREIGVAPADLQELVESRLLRREPRLQEAFYELSHDSLVASLQTAGGKRQAWVTGLKAAAIVLLIFIVTKWGLPHVQSIYEMKSLTAEWADVQQGKVDVAYFRMRLTQARSTVKDAQQLAELQNQFDAWRKMKLQFGFLQAANLDQADSLLKVLAYEYPRETELIAAFNDTLRNRQIGQVAQSYQWLMENDSSSLAFARADSLIKVSYSLFGRIPRVIALEENLKERLGKTKEQENLALERERKLEDLRRELEGAILLEEPKNAIVKGDSSGKASQFEVVLQYSPLLANATVLLNDKKMFGDFSSAKENKLQSVKRQPAKAGKFLFGMMTIPPRAREVQAQITAINNAGSEVAKTFTFAVDRVPPQMRTRKILYKDVEKEDWQNMPPNEWRGNFWRIEMQASEPLQEAALNLRPRYSSTELSQVSSVGADNVQGALANAGHEATFSYATSDKFKTADEVECILVMQDLAGWQNSVNVGKWKIVKAQTAPAIKPSSALPLRRTPEENLTEEEVRSMIKKYDFYCATGLPWSNPYGKGFANDFVSQQKGQVLLDRATGLMWQRSGSTDYITFADARNYIEELNRQKFAGYNNWRLPTLEEAMSLMEPNSSGNLFFGTKPVYINSEFDAKQEWIWTSDNYSAGVAWVATFGSGDCDPHPITDYVYVRVVR